MSDLSDVRIKPIAIELDRPRSLLFDFMAFADVQDEYGSISKAITDGEAGKYRAIITLLWAGLRHEDETLTLRQASQLIKMSNYKYVTDLIDQALIAAMPKQEEQDPNVQSPPPETVTGGIGQS